MSQAALVAISRPRPLPWAGALRSRWWAVLPPLSIAVTIAVVAASPGTATALAWLALIAVPPLAALALAMLVRGAGPAWALSAPALLAVAWAAESSLAGQFAASILTGLACVTLGWLLASVLPASWLKLGIYAMAVVDTWLVATDLLQGPNAVLSAAGPGGVPHLQVVHLGSAQMGFGDFFVAAALGALLAHSRPRQLTAAALVAVLALSFDLLFFAVDTLPATVPVAAALALLGRGRLAAAQL